MTAFPQSARAKWMAQKAQGRPTQAHRSATSPEEKERRALAQELALCLREAAKDQLRQVARALGKSAQWVELVCIEAKTPGAVGKATLRKAR